MHCSEAGPGAPSGSPIPAFGPPWPLSASRSAIGALLAIDDSTAWRTTYAAAGPQVALADLAAGLGLIAAGLYLGTESRGRRLGAILLLAGATWLCADFVGWQGASIHLRMLAIAGTLFTPSLLFHIVAIAPASSPASRPLGLIVVAGYTVTVAIGVGIVLLVDPSADPGCWDICSANPYVLVDAPDIAQTVRSAANRSRS